MARRQVSIFINGKEVANSIKSIAAEKRKAYNELAKLTRGTVEYNAKVKEVKKLNGILSDHRKAIRGVGSTWDKMKGAVGKFAAIAGVSLSADAIIDYGKELFRLGAEMEVLEKKAQTVFGEALPQVTEQAEKNATAMGLTTSQYIDAATAMGDLLIPMQFTREEAANISTNLVDLSGALSEWTGGQRSAEEVSKILSKALLGEREQLKELGISINEADVKARLAAEGMDELTGAELEQAKATTTLQLIMEKTVDAQSAYIENSDTLVRKQAELRAKLINIKENISQNLIPVYGRLLLSIGNVVDKVSDWVSIPLADKLYEERTELNLLVSQITTGNVEQEKRNTLINELQTKYPDFLENIDTESVSNEQLAARLAEVNNQYIFKIALAQEDERIQKVADKLASQQRKLAGKDVEIQQKLLNINEEYQLGLDYTNKTLEERINLTAEALRNIDTQGNETQAMILGREAAGIIASGRDAIEGRVNARSDELTQLQKFREELKKNLQLQLGIKEVTEDTEDTENGGNQNEDTGGGSGSGSGKNNYAQKEANALQKKLDRLKGIIEKHQNDINLSSLSEDEKRLEQIRQKYQKEIDAAVGFNEQIKELERLRDIELQQVQDEIAEKNKQKRADAKLEIDAELRTEQESELFAIQTHYENLIALAEQHGFDTSELKQRFEDEKAALDQKYKDQEVERQRAANDEKVQLQYDLFQAQQEVELTRLGLYSTVADQIAGIASENESLQNSLFLFQKGLAIAEVVISLQSQLAAINLKYAAIPGGIALAAAESVRAKLNAAKSLAVIGGTVVQKFVQKKDGGWMSATGADDNISYRSKFIGQPTTGMLPDHPVLINSSSGSAVLASERGREYFVSNSALKNPYVMNYVRAIDNIVRTRVPQYAEGGSTGTAISANTLPPQHDDRSLKLVISELNDTLKHGIFALLDDDTIIEIFKKYNQLNQASGGLLTQ